MSADSQQPTIRTGIITLKHLVKTTTTLGVLLVLAACGSGTDAGGAGGPDLQPLGRDTANTTSVSQAEQQTNERGFIVKQLGEAACFGGAGMNCEGGVSFAVDKVEVDPQCSEYGSHPDNGHTVLLHLRVATGDDAKVVDRIGGIINPFSFVEIGKDGVTRDVSFGMCTDPSTNTLPDTYGPNQQYQGVMDLEVPEASGIIALQLMGGDEDGQRGWEWSYPTA